MRIAVIARAQDMSSYYRAYEPVEALGRRGHGSVITTGDGAPAAGTFEGDVARFDIGIAPIANTRFNAGRSSIKAKEYAALGIPWLASPIGPYAGLGEEQGGRLVADDRWFEELDALVRDDEARRALAKRGRAWANTQTIERNTGPWEEAFHHAIERARHRRSGAA